MPQFRITAPDGTAYNVTAPEGATEQDALAQVQAQHQDASQSDAPGVNNWSNIGAENTQQASRPADYNTSPSLTPGNVVGMAGDLGLGLLNGALGLPGDLERLARISSRRGGAVSQQNALPTPDDINSGNSALSFAGAPQSHDSATMRDLGSFLSPLAMMRGIPMLAKGAAALLPQSVPTAQRAAGVIDKFAGGPVNIDPRQIVPGSSPTLAEAMTEPNVGVANLQRTVRNLNPQGAIATREMANSDARNAYFGQLAGMPGDIESAKLARDAITTPMREAAFGNASDADASGVDRTINQILASPAGQRDAVVKNLQNIQAKLQVENPLAERISDALGPIKDALSTGSMSDMRRSDFTEARRLLNSAARGYTSEDDLVSGLSALANKQKIVGPIDDALTAIKSGATKFESDPEQLYGIRKAIGDLLSTTGPSTESDARLATSELMTVRDSLDKAIEKAAPGYGDYLSKFSELSKPIDQMQYLQSLGLTDARGNLTLAKVKSALDNIAKAQQKPGLHPAKSLTDDQIAALQNLHSDLHAASNVGIGNAVGSNTVQNAVNLDALLPGRLGAMLGKYGGPEVAGGAIGGAVGFPFGMPGTGAAVGAGLGRVVSAGMAAKSKAVMDAVESMVLNPKLYENARLPANTGQAASAIGNSAVMSIANNPVLRALLLNAQLSRAIVPNGARE